MSVSIDKLPKKWDVVECVKFNKERTMAQICFNTGSKITVNLALKESERLQGQDQSSPRKRPLTEAQKELDYKNRAMEVLNSLGGPENRKIAPKTVVQEQEYIPPANFEELKEQALQRSLARSEALAKELEPKIPLMPKG